MFGSKRREISQRIYEALSPNVALFQQMYGIPPTFWGNPYVLGFLIGQIVAFKHLSGAKEMSASDQVYINMTVLERLSHLNRDFILDNLERSQTLEIDTFSIGRRNGELCVLGTFGFLKNPETDHDYASAKRYLTETNQSTKHSDVMGEVFRRLWFEELKIRLSLV